VSTSEVAVLRDERDLVWMVIGSIQPIRGGFSFDIHFLSRDEPDDAPQPFLGGVGYQEPEAALRSLVESLAGVVLGDIRAMRHDPVQDGLSVEIKAEGQGGDDTFEVVLWLDLTRTSRAMKAWGSRGRQRSGLRFYTTLDRLEEFRRDLDRLAFPAAEA